MTFTFTWTLIIAAVTFVIGLVFGIKLGVRWIKRKFEKKGHTL